MIITMAWVEVDMVPDGTPWRADLGARPCLQEVRRPVALVWLLKGTQEDLARAQVYAKGEGCQVLTYPETEADPLGRAKRDVIK